MNSKVSPCFIKSFYFLFPRYNIYMQDLWSKLFSALCINDWWFYSPERLNVIHDHFDSRCVLYILYRFLLHQKDTHHVVSTKVNNRKYKFLFACNQKYNSQNWCMLTMKRKLWSCFYRKKKEKGKNRPQMLTAKSFIFYLLHPHTRYNFTWLLFPLQWPCRWKKVCCFKIVKELDSKY